ncbi:hypothetical protein PRIPAC_93905, partial [Pristionchus pacificus]
ILHNSFPPFIHLSFSLREWSTRGTMRLWFSLAMFLALLVLLLRCDNDYRRNYARCEDGSVCIFFDYNSCNGQINETMTFRGYIREKDPNCTQNTYGVNYIELSISPEPPTRWNVMMTLIHCHVGCHVTDQATKLQRAKLKAAKFDFGNFTLSFPDEFNVTQAWKDDTAPTTTEMHYKGHFRAFNGHWYNYYSFNVESENKKLIDMVKGNISYNGSMAKSGGTVNDILNNPRYALTQLEEPELFREILTDLNRCDLDMYPFKKDDCPAKSACVKVLNNPIYKTCAFGKLQYSSNNNWTYVYKLKCVNMTWMYEQGANKDMKIQKFEHARCVVTDACSQVVTTALKGGIYPADCEAAVFSNEHNVNCQDGFDLEVYKNDWRYSKNVMCYGDHLSRFDTDDKFFDIVESVRCRKQRTCDLSKFFNDSKCEPGEDCLTPSEDSYSCGNDYQLQYTSISEPTSWKLLDKLECIDNQLRLIIETTQSDIVPLNVRCMKKKKCDLNLFAQPASECGADNVCVEPFIPFFETSNNMNQVLCREEYGLQAQLISNKWETATITCKKGKEDIELIVHESKKVPLQIRCIRKNISKFFDENDCEDHEMCKEPKNCESMKCEFGDQNPLWNLQYKPATSNVWSGVQSVKCNSDKFVVGNVPDTADSLFKFRCVLSKCTLCKDPCPNCVIGSSFNVSNEWNECAMFSCGPNTRTIFGVGDNTSDILNFECSNVDNGASFWKLNGTSAAKKLEIKCEKLCSLQSPLKSSCSANSTYCKAHDSGDFERFSCGRSMYADIGNEDRLHINILKCDKRIGSWKANNVNDDKEVIIPEGSNVYCYEGECDFSRIFPSCESDDNECTDYDKEDHLITCKEPFTFWSRYRFDDDWTEMKGVSELQCLAGSIVENGKRKNYDFQANCRMNIPKTAAAKSKLALYLGVMFLVLLLTVVIIATIIIRISGKGWLHIIVIEMIRDRNKKRARSHSSASSLPKSFPSSKKTRKASPSSKSKNSSKVAKSDRPSFLASLERSGKQ